MLSQRVARFFRLFREEASANPQRFRDGKLYVCEAQDRQLTVVLPDEQVETQPLVDLHVWWVSPNWQDPIEQSAVRLVAYSAMARMDQPRYDSVAVQVMGPHETHLLPPEADLLPLELPATDDTLGRKLQELLGDLGEA